MKKTKIGIIGTGNIGSDLLIKSIKSDLLEPIIFVGRRPDSDGIRLAKDIGIDISIDGINFFRLNKNYCSLVFDCTDAISAKQNYEVLGSQSIKIIDLTPAKLGPLCVPYINNNLIFNHNNINMITCGGQASIPLLHLIAKYCDKLEYIEIVSQIASKKS